MSVKGLERSTMVGPLRHVSEIKVTLDDVRVPIDRYLTAEFKQLENDRLWPKVWQLVCREDELSEPGDFREVVVDDRSFVLVRGQDGVIRALHNVCPHRGNIIKTGCGNTGQALVCPFHMWSFKLDGSLRTITDRDTFCELDDADYALGRASAGTWGGWVFLHPSAEPDQSLLDFLAPLPELLDAYHLEQLVPVGLNLTTTVSANWKVAVEAFLEVYHVHAIHPQLLPNGDDQNVWFEHWDRHSRMTRPFGVPSPRLGEIELEEVLEALYGARPDEVGPLPVPGGQATVATADADLPGDRREGDVNGGSGDYFRTMVHEVGSPWWLVEEYRDETGHIELPDGVTLRDLLRKFYVNAAQIKGVDFSGLEPDQFVDNFHYLLFPNVIVNVNVGSVLFMRFMPDPSDPQVCTWDIVTYDWVPDKARAKAVSAPHRTIAERAESLGLLLDQDVSQMPRVQRGLRTGLISNMTLSRQENRLIHFNEVIGRYLDGAS